MSVHRRSPRLLLPLIALSAVCLSPARTAPETTDVWEKDIRAFEEQDRKSPPPADAALFVGSSSIRMWTTLARDFPEIPVINRGFGGSAVKDSTRYLERIVFPCKPRLIVMYAGTNDISSGATPEQVFEDFKAFVSKARAGLPGVPILYISINPNIARWEQRQRQAQANRLIERWMHGKDRMKFINSWPAFLGPDGRPVKRFLSADNLHLSPEGYAAWKEVVKPVVLRMYRKYAPGRAG
jgi:lysophospholipase L1-like esterase